MNFHRIVVATAFSEVSLHALETAFELTLEQADAVYLLHVVEPYRTQRFPWGSPS